MELDCASGRLATITVTHHPNTDVLDRQLSQLPADAVKIVVDNASRLENLVTLRRIARKHGALLMTNSDNVGLAAATNQGARLARQLGCDTILLLDQDTEPGCGGVVALRVAYCRVLASGLPPGCIGPRLADVGTGLEHGFHRIRGWRWLREFPKPVETPVQCSNLNGSGTLVPLEIFEALGGLNEGMFIDHVDTDWSFRVVHAGYGLYGASDVVFRHRMGERSLRFWWLRWRLWPYRLPFRHRFLFRNAVWLMRSEYVPAVWKVWAFTKLVLTALVHLVFDSARWAQVRAMARGLREGMQPRGDKGNANE